jgi:hypothetical protein
MSVVAETVPAALVKLEAIATASGETLKVPRIDWSAVRLDEALADHGSAVAWEESGLVRVITMTSVNAVLDAHDCGLPLDAGNSGCASRVRSEVLVFTDGEQDVEDTPGIERVALPQSPEVALQQFQQKWQVPRVRYEVAFSCARVAPSLASSCCAFWLPGRGW